MLALTFLWTTIKKALYKKRATHYEQLIFQNRLMALLIYAIFMIIAPFLNSTYPFKLLFCSLVCQSINLAILLSQKNTYISAISCQITFFIPLYFTAAKLENSLRIPCVSLAVSVLYYLQFYPLITNISFMCFIFFLVSKPKAQLLELFYFDERFSTILSNGIGGWPLATCFIFFGISAYQILNEKIWKDYISAKREIQKKNQELQLANQRMAEMVSKLEQTNQRLEVSNKELGEALKSQDLFVACVSHELRNPLNAMMGNIELLQQENLSESHKKMLKTCQVCGDILLVLINNILDVAKINADKLEINPSSINIQSIIEKIWDVSKVRIVQKGLKGRLVISDNLPLWLKADAHRIMQIILNLINNATKFTNSGGITVLISWKDEQSLQREEIFQTTVGESDGPYFEENSVYSDEFNGGKNFIDVSRGSGKLALITDIKSQQAIILTEKDSDMKILKEKLEVHTNRQGIFQVEVIDTGCGISSEAQSKIFQPFVQGDSSVTRKYGGTGLGLYIIKQLIGKMNGTIQVSSEPNQGARFTLRLPLSTLTSEEAKQVMGLGSLVKKDSANRITNKHQALVVDDNHYNQTVLKSYLNKMDIHVDFADNGLESLQKIQNNPPGYYSFVTMDIQMPVMDGITASKKIRQYENSLRGAVSPIPIIIVTGNCSLNEQKECMDPQGEIKAAYFFNKPFLFADCKIAVEFLLSEKEKSPICGKKKKILVVDDDSFNRDLLRVQIQRLGLSCELCPSGIEALEKLRNNQEFGVVLMDFEMPGMNGIEATKRIRAEIKGEELYIIGTTGNVEEETKRNSLESGMDKVLTKPISLVQITMLFKDLKLLK